MLRSDPDLRQAGGVRHAAPGQESVLRSRLQRSVIYYVTVYI